MGFKKKKKARRKKKVIFLSLFILFFHDGCRAFLLVFQQPPPCQAAACSLLASRGLHGWGPPPVLSPRPAPWRCWDAWTALGGLPRRENPTRWGHRRSPRTGCWEMSGDRGTGAPPVG